MHGFHLHRYQSADLIAAYRLLAEANRVLGAIEGLPQRGRLGALGSRLPHGRYGATGSDADGTHASFQVRTSQLIQMESGAISDPVTRVTFACPIAMPTLDKLNECRNE